MTSQVHGDTNSDGLCLVDLIEVSVQQRVRCGVELKLLDDSLVLSTINVQIDNIYVGSVHCVTQLSHRGSESQCLGQTVLTLLLTIQIAGNHTLLAKQL